MVLSSDVLVVHPKCTHSNTHNNHSKVATQLKSAGEKAESSRSSSLVSISDNWMDTAEKDSWEPVGCAD